MGFGRAKGKAKIGLTVGMVQFLDSGLRRNDGGEVLAVVDLWSAAARRRYVF